MYNDHFNNTSYINNVITIILISLPSINIDTTNIRIIESF